MTGQMWFFRDELPGEFTQDNAIPPITDGDTATPLALPVTRGDKITITYPDDADVPQAGKTEVFHYLGTRGDMVILCDEENHQRAKENNDAVYITTANGVWDFNRRVLEHAESVEVERVEVPSMYGYYP